MNRLLWIASILVLLLFLSSCSSTIEKELWPISPDGLIGRLVVRSESKDSVVWDNYIVEIVDIAKDQYRIIDTLPDFMGSEVLHPVYYYDSASVVHEQYRHRDTAYLVVRRFVPPKAEHVFAKLPVLDSNGNRQAVSVQGVQPRDSLLLLTGSEGTRIAAVNQMGSVTILKQLPEIPEADYPVFSDDGKQLLYWQCNPDSANCTRWTLVAYDIAGDSSYVLFESWDRNALGIHRRTAQSPVFYQDTPNHPFEPNLYCRVESMDSAVQVTHYRDPYWVSYYWLMNDSIALWVKQSWETSREQHRIEIVPMPKLQL